MIKQEKAKIKQEMLKINFAVNGDFFLRHIETIPQANKQSSIRNFMMREPVTLPALEPKIAVSRTLETKSVPDKTIRKREPKDNRSFPSFFLIRKRRNSAKKKIQ